VKVHRDKSRIIKATRCNIFSILFWNEILHVSDSSSVQRQEYFTIHTAMVYEVGPKNKRNLNMTRELETVARYAARCHEPGQYSSSLSLGVDLG
jgi:hypothetical protein